MIYPIFKQMLSRAEREKKLRQRAKVVWLYGLSGSGKSHRPATALGSDASSRMASCHGAPRW